MQIVQENALLFTNMLQYPDEEEQQAAIRVLWTLAFDDKIRDQIHHQEGCVEALEALAKSEVDGVRNAACGALWVINSHHKRG